MTKNILLIAPKSFPPYFSSGSIRNAKYVKYLFRNGFNVNVFKDVVVNSEMKDSALFEETKEFCSVTEISNSFFKYKENINNVLAVNKNKISIFVSLKNVFLSFFISFKKFLMGIIRYLFFIPDEHILWVISVYRYILKNYTRKSIDVIITSGPPFSSHILGILIKRKYKIIWVSDFRDKWMDHIVFNPKTVYRRIIEKYFEKMIVKKSDLLITATSPISEYFEETYIDYREKIYTITNGYDESDFKTTGKCVLDKNFFNIVYTGSIGGYLNPDVFIRSFLEIKNEDIDLFQNTRLIFAGKLMEDSKSHFYGDNQQYNILYLGLLNHNDAISLMKEANALLLIIYEEKGGETIMCGKFYEYLGTGNPILALIPKGIAFELINKHGLGYISNPKDKEDIKTNIRKSYDAWKNNKPIHYDIDMSMFTREYQVKRLIELIYKKGKNELKSLQ